MPSVIDSPQVLQSPAPQIQKRCTCAAPHKPSWRIFAQAYANGETGVKSYMLAYPKASYDSARSHCHELTDNPCVQAEIDRFRREHEKSAQIDIERELLWNIDGCKQSQQYANHREALKLQAQLTGKLVERHEDVSEQVRKLSEDELWAELKRRMDEHERKPETQDVVVQPESHSEQGMTPSVTPCPTTSPENNVL